MKRSLLGNALLALAITLVFRGLFFSPERQTFFLEATIRADTEALAQVFYDVGQGLREEDSSRQFIPRDIATTCRFDLPPGDYRTLRFDPLDRRGRATISELTLRSPSGLVLRHFRLGEFQPNEQLTVQVNGDGAATIVSTDSDPSLELTLVPPLALKAAPLGFFARNAPKFAAFLASTFVFLVVVQQLVRGNIPRLARWWAARRTHPLATLAVVAGFATLLACHPLVIAGKSLVSPNFHVSLVYENPPTVPGFSDPRVEEVPGADLGAMMWAHLPYTGIEHQALHAGEFPLWNRYSSTGLTLLGQGQSMVGDPVHLLVGLTNAASWAFDAKFILLRALFACGLAWTVFALRRDWAAAAIVAFSAPFIGLFAFRINHAAIFSVCYAPWVLFAWVCIIQADTLRRATRGCALLFAANWILFASGTVKEADMLLASLNAIGLAAFAFAPDPGGHKLAKTVVVALAGFAFALATMPLWLTFADALGRSQNFSAQPATARIPPNWIIGLFDDLFYRELSADRHIYCPSMNLLLGAGVVWSIARFRDQLAHPIVRWIFLGGFVAVGIAVDWIPSAWILRVPGIGNLGHQHDVFSCVAIVILSVLAGCGFASARVWFTHPSARKIETLTLLVIVSSLLFGLYFTATSYLWWTEPTYQGWLAKLPDRAFFYASLLAMLIGLALLHSLARRTLRTGIFSWSGVSWAALALFVLLARHGLQLPIGFRSQYFVTPPARANLQATSPAIERLQAETAAIPGRVIGTGATLVPNFGAQFGFEMISGPDALMNRHYRQLITDSGLGVANDWYIGGTVEKLAVQHAMLDLLNVKFCISPSRELPPETGFRRIADLDLALYANPTVWPRAFFTDRVISYRGAHEIAEHTRAHPGEPFAAVLESDLAHLAPDIAPRPDTHASFTAPASNYRLTPNSTSFDVHARGPGAIVLHEAWLKGDFRATINGVRAEYFRVNHAFKGLAVSRAGDYRVTFTYWPRYFTLSLACSVAGFALLAAMLLIAQRGEFE